MNRTRNEAQRDLLIATHNAIVDVPFSQLEPISQHEVVDILAAVLAAQYDNNTNHDGKQPSDQRR